MIIQSNETVWWSPGRQNVAVQTGSECWVVLHEHAQAGSGCWVVLYDHPQAGIECWVVLYGHAQAGSECWVILYDSSHSARSSSRDRQGSTSHKPGSGFRILLKTNDSVLTHTHTHPLQKVEKVVFNFF